MDWVTIINIYFVVKFLKINIFNKIKKASFKLKNLFSWFSF